MFLEKLSEYASQIEQLPPPMYQRTTIRYMIYLDTNGNYIDVGELLDDKGKATLPFEAPHVKRSSGIRPKLLVDNGEYTLGFSREKSDPRRVQEQHRAFVTLVQECAVATREPSVVAVAHFLRLPDITAPILRKQSDFDPSSNVAFQVGNTRPFELKTVQEYWAKKAASNETEQTMQCLVCGNWRSPVERLPIVIKGIPGGQSMGLTLISANAAAFESYGLTASLIAPTCEECGERFGNALNELLRNSKTHIVLPPLAYIFWTKSPSKPDFDDGIDDMPALMAADPGTIKKLYQAARRGKSTATLVNAPDFYAATLSASGARVVLRDWIETSVAVAQEYLKRFFWLQRIQLPDVEPRYFPLRLLISATQNQKSKEKPSALVGEALMHVALYGGSLPTSLLYSTIQRIRATRKVEPEQVALIKMVLLSQQDARNVDYEEDLTMATHNEEETDIAYLCGRLLAQLDYIQLKALGRVNATIVDRFYGTASTAPALVFPRLLKMAIPHLATIRPPAKNIAQKSYAASLSYPDKELTQLLEKLPSAFPSTLTLEQQGRFALGFFFQKAQYLSHWREKMNDSASLETPDTTNDYTDTTQANEEE